MILKIIKLYFIYILINVIYIYLFYTLIGLNKIYINYAEKTIVICYHAGEKKEFFNNLWYERIYIYK